MSGDWGLELEVFTGSRYGASDKLETTLQNVAPQTVADHLRSVAREIEVHAGIRRAASAHAETESS